MLLGKPAGETRSWVLFNFSCLTASVRFFVCQSTSLSFHSFVCAQLRQLWHAFKFIPVEHMIPTFNKVIKNLPQGYTKNSYNLKLLFMLS